MATRKRAAHPRKKLRARGSKLPSRAATRPEPAPRPTHRPTKRAGTKSAFILGFSHDTPSRTIVEAGAAKGLSFTQSYVATIRALERKRTGVKATRSVGRPRRDSAPLVATERIRVDGRDGLESRFARLALDIGLARAAEVLHLLQSQIDRLTR